MTAIGRESGSTHAEAWRKTVLPASANLKEAIRCLSDSALQVVLVASPEGMLIGTLTDGDIRRGLLSGLQLDSPIEGIIHRRPLVVPPEWGREVILPLMRANKVHRLPIIDRDGRITGLHSWDELLVPDTRPNTMVLMAGGRGRRLGSYTENCPKPLLPVGGKPMLEHIIDRAKADGIRNFVVAVHYLAEMIEEYFGDGGRWEVSIEYLRERTPLGTAGALGLLEPRPSASFLVSNGDVLADIRYGELLDFHTRHGASATMAVRLFEWQHPFGVVKTKGVDIVGFEEKPVLRSHINAGIYVFEPGALDSVPRNEPCDMPLLFTNLQGVHARTIVYPMHEPWLDVGHPRDLERARDGRSIEE